MVGLVLVVGCFLWGLRGIGRQLTCGPPWVLVEKVSHVPNLLVDHDPAVFAGIVLRDLLCRQELFLRHAELQESVMGIGM